LIIPEAQNPTVLQVGRSQRKAGGKSYVVSRRGHRNSMRSVMWLETTIHLSCMEEILPHTVRALIPKTIP
jgi:hypothetical protein